MISRKCSCLIVSVLLLATAGVAPSSAALSTTIRNVPPTPHFAPIGTPLRDLAAAIQMAADTQGWRIVSETPGLILASLRVRTHEAWVTIGFDESNFWIDYWDSSNLNYNPKDLKKTRTRRGIKGPRIHRNYNIWVSSFAKAIAMRARIPPKAKLPETAPQSSPTMIADELRKLDELRRGDVLTQEEFDRQKAKLLAQ